MDNDLDLDDLAYAEGVFATFDLLTNEAKPRSIASAFEHVRHDERRQWDAKVAALKTENDQLRDRLAQIRALATYDKEASGHEPTEDDMADALIQIHTVSMVGARTSLT